MGLNTPAYSQASNVAYPYVFRHKYKRSVKKSQIRQTKHIMISFDKPLEL